MASGAIVRLGPTSAGLSKGLADAPQGAHAEPLTLKCAQVPNEFDVGSKVWIWLGSDNNKGQPTAWTQGIRGIGECDSKVALGGGQFDISLSGIYIFTRTIEKAELLQTSPETYARFLSQAAIVGLNNYSSQVVQLLNEEEVAAIAALIATALPSDADALRGRIPSMGDVVVFDRPTDSEEPSNSQAPQALEETIEQSELSDDDPILVQVQKLVFEDGVGGVLLAGPPGTGKSWYARQIALKLNHGRLSRMREVQFHPAYQYEDFVEGYVPDGARGFVLTDKHLLVMAALAKESESTVVLVIDEFSRTDPSRVLGETMTYMESSYRDKEFRLPSGRRASIPKNLIFLATMNPEDRSVEEIDAAMERRWAKVTLAPDASKLKGFLQENAVNPKIIPAVLQFFVDLQDFAAIGHAYFRSVRDAASLKRLWDSQLSHVLAKKYRFDAATTGEVTQLWQRCFEQVSAVVEVAEGAAPDGKAADPVAASAGG